MWAPDGCSTTELLGTLIVSIGHPVGNNTSHELFCYAFVTCHGSSKLYGPQISVGRVSADTKPLGYC